MKNIRLILAFAIGYMLKSLIVTFGATNESLTINIVFLFWAVSMLCLTYCKKVKPQ